MNNKYITESLQNYKIDLQLTDEFCENVRNEILEDVNKVKLIDNEFYKILFDVNSRFDHKLLIESYILNSYMREHKEEYEEIINNLIDELLYDVYDESTNLMRKDLKDKAHDISLTIFAGTGVLFLAKFMIPILYHGGKDLLTFFVKTMGKSVGIGAEGGSNPLAAIFILSSLFIALFVFNGHIKHNILPVFKGIYEGFKTIISFKGMISLINSDVFILKNKILHQNINNCKERCGVGRLNSIKSVKMASALFRDKSLDPELPNMVDRNTVGRNTGNYRSTAEQTGRKSFFSNLFDASDDENEAISERMKAEVECLTECYMDYIITIFAELAASYINCMEKSHGFDDEYKDYSFQILLQSPTDRNCATLHVELVAIYAEFNKILQLVYRNDNGEVQKWLKALDTKVKTVMRNQHITPGSNAVSSVGARGVGTTSYRGEKGGFRYN